MNDERSHHESKFSPELLTTLVGSTAAVVGALGVTAIAANTAPLIAAVLTAGSTAVAAGALYHKLTGERRSEGRKHESRDPAHHQ